MVTGRSQETSVALGGLKCWRQADMAESQGSKNLTNKLRQQMTTESDCRVNVLSAGGICRQRDLKSSRNNEESGNSFMKGAGALVSALAPQ